MYGRLPFPAFPPRNPQLFRVTASQGPYWPSSDQSSATSLRHKFSPAEDELLKRLVAKFGELNWTAVSANMRSRSARQCRERYRNYLNPALKNGPWTDEEEALLEKKVSEIGQKWSTIAQFFETRSEVNIKNHWLTILNKHYREKDQKQAPAAALMEQNHGDDGDLQDFPPLHLSPEPEWEEPKDEWKAAIFKELEMESSANPWKEEKF